jgi:hypothetical protein
LDRKQQLSVVGCTGQSGAPPDIYCAVSGARQVSRPLAPVAVDRWIRPLPSAQCTPDSPVYIGQSGATARERLSVASLRRLSGVTPDSLVHTGHYTCPNGRAGPARHDIGVLRHGTTMSRAGPGWHVGPNPCPGTARLILIGPGRAGGTGSPLVPCRARAQLYP